MSAVSKAATGPWILADRIAVIEALLDVNIENEASGNLGMLLPISKPAHSCAKAAGG